VLAVVAMVALVAIAGMLLRYGVLTPQGRLLIEARASGLKLGRVGRLKVEGLDGDVWRAFSIRKLTIADEKGVWLEADKVLVDWRYESLFLRRLDVSHVAAARVLILRRPTLTPKGKSGGLPVTIHVGDARLRLQTLQAFSVRPGLFDVAAGLDLRRKGGERGHVEALSLMHRGDFLKVKFDIAPRRPLDLDVEGVEGQGGALAGALGLPADRPFRIDVKAHGVPARGTVDAVVRTGAETPLLAQGGWTRAGGMVGGRVRLAASTLTGRYVAMVGPEARFGLAARRAREGGYGVGVRLIADNLSLAAQGPADLDRRQSRQGLTLDASVGDLSRIFHDPFMGPGRLLGRIMGEPADWRFAGSASVERVRLSDFQLARVSGPLELSGRKGEIAAKAELQGAGGSGSGVIAGLVGAAPKAQVSLARLADGRLLIRSIDAQARGATVKAQGSRGLLGDLNFRGELTLTDLKLAHPAAGGRLQARWSAIQASQAKPWLFTLDGRGDGFRSGLGELDRLLGARPALKLKATYGHGQVGVEAARLDGDKAGLGAKGLLGPNGSLKLALDWTAQGPFAAGPLEISGNAKGTGALTGTLSAPKADLITDVSAIDVPRLPLQAAHIVLSFAKAPNGWLGQVAVNASSQYGPARARSDFRFVPDGLDLTGLDADAGGVKAKGALSLRGGSPSTADLQLAVGTGVLLTRGSAGGALRITAGPGPAMANLDLHAKDAVVRDSGVWLRSAAISGSGPLTRLPLHVQAEGEASRTPFAMDGQGLLTEIGADRELAFTGSGKVRQAGFTTTEPLRFRFGPGGRLLHARLDLGGGHAVLDAKDAGGAFNATGALQGVDMKALNADFVGRLAAGLQLHGIGPKLDGTMTARLTDARSIDAPADMAVNGLVKAVLSDTQVSIDASAAGAEGMTASTSLVLPTEASAAPLRIAIVRNREISGRFSAQGELKPLWDLLFSADRELGGRVQMAGTLGGTLADPKVTGHADLANGSFEDAGTGLKLTALTLNADLGRDLVTVSNVSAKDGKDGTVTGGGTLSLDRGGASSFKLQFTRFRLVDNDTLTATGTGEATVTRGADGKAKLVGELSIDRAEVNAETKLRPGVVSMAVVERNRPERMETQFAPPARNGVVGLDVRLRAPRRIFVRGRGLNAELSMFARVTGTTADPVLDGTARVVQGDYDFAGKRFQFEERGSISLDTQPERIRLDLSATWTEPSLTATIQIRGSAAKPEITLTSAPALPQDEILARVLFGTSASQLSNTETAQLASTLSALAAGGGFDVLGGLRQIAHLDRLTFGADESGSATVAGGKYLTDDVYLELVGGGRYGPTAEVDWRIKRNFSIVSQLGGLYGTKLAVRWRHDIGGRKRGPKGAPQSAPPPPAPPITH
jgi:translocation and assembly module TamB